MADKAFPRDTHLTAIAIAYKNPDVSLVSDAVLPRVPVGKRTFGWTTYPVGEMYTVPDTRVGEYSQVNRVTVQGTKVTSEVEDFGIEIPLTRSDIDDAPPNVNPRDRATERATNIVLLDREIRVAALCFAAASYGAAQKTQLSGTTQWSHADSDPIKAILTGLNAALIRPNRLVMGQETWSAFSVHAKVVSACLGNAGQYGVATRERVAELLGLAEVLVGAAMVNSVKPGKTPVLAKVWGKHALAFYSDRTVDTAGGITFGYTAEHGTRVAGAKDVDMGLHGGVAVRSGESIKECIVAPMAAYFWQDAVA